MQININNKRFNVINNNGVIYIKQINPYDEADYYYAVYKPNTAQLIFTQNNGKNKKRGLVKYTDTNMQIEEIAKELLELNKSVEPKMSYESLGEEFKMDTKELNEKLKLFMKEEASDYYDRIQKCKEKYKNLSTEKLYSKLMKKQNKEYNKGDKIKLNRNEIIAQLAQK